MNKYPTRRHPLEIMLGDVKLRASDACKAMKITPSTFCQMKHNYLDAIGNKKLMVLAALLGIQFWELIFILERHKRLTDADKQYMGKRIKKLDKDFGFPPL